MAKKLEYKYLVPSPLLADIRSEIHPYMEMDEHARARETQEYTVRSVYYDTPGVDFYWEKIEGIRVRKKLRIRGYNQQDGNSIVFLEIKRKCANHIEKNRAPLLRQDLGEFFSTGDLDSCIISLNGDGNGEEKSNAQRFLYHYYYRGLRPTVLITYEREAFMCKFGPSLRVTFDKNLRSAVYPSLEMLYRETQMKYAMGRHFILELKFHGGLPSWLRSVIRRYQLSRMALSKYTICLDSHNMRGRHPRRVLSGFLKHESVLDRWVSESRDV